MVSDERGFLHPEIDSTCIDSENAIEKWTNPPVVYKRSIKVLIFDMLPQSVSGKA